MLWNNLYIILLTLIFNSEILYGHKLAVNFLDYESYNCVNKNIKILKTDIFDSRYQIFHLYDDHLNQCQEHCCSSVLCNAVFYAEHSCTGFNIPVVDFFLPVTSPNRSQIQESSQRSKRSISKTRNSPHRRSVLCQKGSHMCPQNEYCNVEAMQKKGVCACIVGTARNINNDCIPSVSNQSSIIPKNLHLQSNQATTEYPSFNDSFRSAAARLATQPTVESSVAPRKLVVNISNKTIDLKPGVNMYTGWATLSAYAIGGADSDFTYKWTLLNKPPSDKEGAVKDTNKQTVALSKLVVGVYQFKVEVTGPNAAGEAVGSVTIVPAKHRNLAPIARISPSNLTVKLPNSVVIFDGSESKDDNEIASFHWEILMGPISYKLDKYNDRTLELKNLIAGNYTIMLEVEDKEGLKGKATATLSVVKETDYPPTANAGGDKNIHLPVDNVVLNGTLSSDDHGIKEWEWTKGPEDSGNAVDMQFTRQPILQLSDLEEGHYHFILKVVDTSGQTAESPVHVYVHSSLDSVPVANAGKNISLVIPNTSTVLDGSASTGVSPTTHYLWKQLSGPKTATLSPNSSVTVNVTQLTKGDSIFRLTVWNGDDSLKNSTSNVTINVVQEKNVPPVANAGQDFKVTLPTSAIIVNGSLSKDDVAISKWLWKRDETSLAAGNVIETSYKSPILILTNVVPGRYVWNLTVWDDQGSSSSDTVSIIVENPPYHMNQVEVIVGVGMERLSVAQKENLIQKLHLIYSSAGEDDVRLDIEEIRGMPLSGKTSLVIVGRRAKVVVSGVVLAQQLRTKIMNPSNPRLLDLPIISIETVVCQNNCSGHGECIQASRHCRCNSWWMESIFRRHFGDGVTNCDWSVIYVFVGSLGSALVIGILIWLAAAYGSRKWRSSSKRRTPRYSLLETHDENRLAPARSLIDSDSESGSEVLFDARKPRASKGDKRTNGHIIMQRIRT